MTIKLTAKEIIRYGPETEREKILCDELEAWIDSEPPIIEECPLCESFQDKITDLQERNKLLCERLESMIKQFGEPNDT